MTAAGRKCYVVRARQSGSWWHVEVEVGERRLSAVARREAGIEREARATVAAVLMVEPESFDVRRLPCR